MTAAKRPLPVAEAPRLRLLERPPRLAPRPAEPARPGLWQRWAEVLRRPR